MSELALQLIEKEKKERTGILDLGGCGLTDLPEEIFELKWLRELSFNDFNTAKLTNSKKSLYINKGIYNRIETKVLPQSFEELVNLVKLDLGGPFFKEWKLRDVNILKKLSSLKELDLSENGLSDISFLSKLINIKHLDLSSNQISDISVLKNLVSLEYLNISFNTIKDINPLIHLSKLESLELNSTLSSDYSSLQKLTSLKKLQLNSNHLIDINFLIGLTKLKDLTLSDNCFIKDFSILQKFDTLYFLDLSLNKINDISNLLNLNNISFLNLSNNRITNIYPLIPLLRKGISTSVNLFSGALNLSDNPITNPPIKIVEKGTEAILDWFAQIDESGSEPFYESKLMILGQGGAGKTTFANLLINSNYEVKPGKLESTLGIVVHKGVEFPNSDVIKPNIKANLWDFGGQDIQKMLHQFFITEECLYVLVSDKRAENTNFDYWFQIINLLGPKSHVIVLENPKESNGNNEDFPKIKYQRLYPDLIIESLEVNLNETRGKDKALWIKLNQMISYKLSNMELVNRLVPKKWGIVRKQLEELKKKKYITLDVFYEICTHPEIGFNNRQADWCLSYFRSLGDLVYFDDHNLCTNIFLDQNWLTTGLYYILSDKQIKEDSGRFSQQQAFDKWQGKGYNKTEKAMLINLLLKDKFNICYELPDEKEVFITPLLLSSDAPEQKWKYQPNLQFRFCYGFIPHGLFSRLIVQLHDKIDAEQQWKTGVRLINTFEGKEVYAEVQQYNDPEENQQVIDIKISGEKNGSKQMLAFIRTAVEKLHKDFKNIQVKQVVACNCENCSKRMKKGEKPSFFDFEKLQKKALNKSYFEECENSNYKGINIGLVLNDVIIENAAVENKDSQLLNQLKEIGMSINQIINNNTNTNISNNNNTNTNTNTNTITITIQQVLAETDNLKKAIEKDLKIKKVPEEEIEYAKADVEDAEDDFKEIELAQQEKREPSLAAQTRLHGFMSNLIDEDSTFHKTLKMLRKGKDYGVKIARAYNMVAQNLALPSMPPIILDVLEKL
jgi:internalin A